MKQLLLEKPNYLKYINNKDELVDKINNRAGDISFYTTNFNPYPIELEDNFLQEIDQAHECVLKAVKAIVNNYLHDNDIKNIIKLSNRSIDLIRLASIKDYNAIGTLRPDFIIDVHGCLRICEINARFPINGYWLSHYLAEEICNTTYACNKFKNNLANIVDIFTQYFDLSKPISIVKNREHGYDIHLLYRDLKKSYGCVINFVSPSQLSLKNKQIHNGTTICDQFILELHQDELLNIPKDIVKKIVVDSKYLNDIRTILIAHDKRILAVMTNQLIMKRYLTAIEFALLQRYIIPTYLLSDVIVEIERDWKKWVLKKYFSGKGEGMLVGLDCNKDELSEIITNQCGNYIAQHCVKQKTFPITILDKNDISTKQLRFVGIILSFNEYLLGPGFFRGGLENIINVSKKGGVILVPVKI